MSFFDNVMIILCLISVSCFLSLSEIALAASRKIRLGQLADEGDVRAERVLHLQAHPGSFFTVVDWPQLRRYYGWHRGGICFYALFQNIISAMDKRSLVGTGKFFSLFRVGDQSVYFICRFNAQTFRHGYS